MLAGGTLRVVVGGSYRLADARLAHEALLGRSSCGKLVLVPAEPAAEPSEAACGGS
jgi:hypothetical protein